VEKGYFRIRRTWKPGDRITIQFDMEARLSTANPLVRDDIGKVAVERGPLVYAAEGLDQPSDTNVFDWHLAAGPGPGNFTSTWKPDLLGGIVTLALPALRPATPNGGLPLYQAMGTRKYVAGELTLIPYYTYQNREPTSMEVWIPFRQDR
jgi:DUF1680 family protein